MRSNAADSLNKPARMLHQLARKIGQGFDLLKNFPSERNSGVYFRVRKILQEIKASARARHTGAKSGLDEINTLQRNSRAWDRLRQCGFLFADRA